MGATHDPAPPPSRNAPCSCRSGRRYKDCHGRLPGGPPSGGAPAVRGPAPVADAQRRRLDEALALQRAHRRAEAEALYRAALAHDPDEFDALHMLGVLRHGAGDHHEAIALLRRAAALRPDCAPVHSNLSLALVAMHRYAEAQASIDLALALAPDFADALNNRGRLLAAQLRHAEALACFDAALARAPDQPDLLSNRGNALSELRRHEDAARCFARLLEVAPDRPWALGALHEARMHCCDWEGREGLVARIEAAVRDGRRAVAPFVHLALSSSPADQLAAARIHAAAFADAPRAAPPRSTAGPADGRIRIAYLSADFRQHPTSQLAAGLFETHDRAHFEVTAISFGPDTGDPLRRRLECAFDRFVDVRDRTDDEVAALIRAAGIDICVDLMGYTNNGRPRILARRPAPLQVGYLGYPGTLGGNWLDYLVADPHTVRAGEEQHYAERVVRLPHTYFPHDPAQRIGACPSRAQAGLPERAFVYCCFNNNYKILPATFDAWMRILAAVEGSVLWLFAPGEVAQRNLRREAGCRDVDPARLVFADRVAPDDHLARHALADLFLDTHPYNAHTTAVDSLWAGLPVLTFPGTTMAGRVATGIVLAAGLPELVARDAADYEARAIALARDPAALRSLRERLVTPRRDALPLFDAGRYRRGLETAYRMMWRRHLDGLAPASFDVAPFS